MGAVGGYLLAGRRRLGVESDLDADVLAGRVAELLRDGQQRELSASARLDARLEALGNDLGRMTGLMRQLETGRAEQYGDLSRQLQQTMQVTSDLTSTTRDLHQVLGSNNARGQWGERMADDVLRAAGLVEGINYFRGQSLASGGVPDVTLLLPQGRRIHMDVKFPVASYVRYLQAENDDTANRHRAAFIRDARQRLREVIRRDYLDADDGIGLALLLIPNEAVFAFLQQHEPALFDEAMSAGIAVCSPLTLFAVLAVVRQAVDSVHLAEASAQIRQCLQTIDRQWQAFTRDLDKLGTHLRHAQRTHDDLAGAGRRALDQALAAAVAVRQGATEPQSGAESETTAREPDGPLVRSFDS